MKGESLAHKSMKQNSQACETRGICALCTLVFLSVTAYMYATGIVTVREDGGVVWSSDGAPFAHPVSCLL